MGEDVHGGEPTPQEDPRRADRLCVSAEVALRRTGQLNYRVRAYDLSVLGCRLEFVERPQLAERVWIKFANLDSIEGMVRWVDGFQAGIEFTSPIYLPVFEKLVAGLR
jgi:hypothetical protein